MTDVSRHDWLSQIEVSGPFLAEPVLREIFPQGLAWVDPERRRTLRLAYDEWREAVDENDGQLSAIHKAWVELVLQRVLELDADILKSGSDIPSGLEHVRAEFGVTLRPHYAVTNQQEAAKPLCLICTYPPGCDLSGALKGDGWAASPAERMVDLCRGLGVRLGLITNGEAWMLIDAPVGSVTSFATWFARLWVQEPTTLQAFVELLSVRRFFLEAAAQLPALIDRSVVHQDEVTEALGEQVRRAIEVLIQALDRADLDRGRELLAGLAPRDVYEAALTVMMRIVFLLSAEERGLLLMGDERYEAYYAVSTLRSQLRGEPDEILERRYDAWSRLLAIFRVVFGGVAHEDMRLPALGGSLFDPDRYPFLEGRAAGTSWRSDPSTPLRIDNRTVLLILEAVQLFQGRTLSYRALDVEQIGHVYEGLLERTVRRAKAVTLDLSATKSAQNPWVTLPELETAAASGRAAVEALLKERTGSSAGRVKNDLNAATDAAAAEKLLTACNGDVALRDRLRRYFHFLRTDRWGYPLVYPEGTYMVASGSDRRETGAHYTPKSLTEVIVKETLEPIVYVGPAEGASKEQWCLKSPAELLDLKICDPAMGSGAFLVQVCRYMAERLVEAWARAETEGKFVTSLGEVLDVLGAAEPLRNDIDERMIVAARIVAERCLYGVDMNPLAVELAKLSIWLVTLAKGRPFGFLDHNLRCGDSLLGITSLDQLRYLEVKPAKGSSRQLFASKIDGAVDQAIALRAELRSRPILDITDVEAMARLDSNARAAIEVAELVADALIGEALNAGGGAFDQASLAIDISNAIQTNDYLALRARAQSTLRSELSSGSSPRRPLHWPLSFPEVFTGVRIGFDALVGNPPFMGGRKIANALTRCYHDFLSIIRNDEKGAPDLCAYFFLRANALAHQCGMVGMIATNSLSQTGSRAVCLDQILAAGGAITFAVSSQEWPGAAAVTVSLVVFARSDWKAGAVLDGIAVDTIDGGLERPITLQSPGKLASMKGRFSQGQDLMGQGFELNAEERATIITADPISEKVIFPLFNGRDINNSPDLKPTKWVINFGQMKEADARQFRGAFDRVERLVKPYRDSLTGQIHEQCFWKFWDYRKKLVEQYENHSEILASAVVTKYVAFRFVPTGNVYSQKTKLYYFYRFAEFSILQSTLHTEWAQWRCATLGSSTFSYSTTAALETWPMPGDTSTLDKCEEIGAEYHALRAKLMVQHDEGITGVYNRFHSAENLDPGIVSLRNLQVEMDRLALVAYGWDDLKFDHDFRSVSYLPANDSERFTVSEKIRRILLARLVELNIKRRKEEGARSLPRSQASKSESPPGLLDDGQ
jgi:hypothetical protein